VEKFKYICSNVEKFKYICSNVEKCKCIVLGGNSTVL